MVDEFTGQSAGPDEVFAIPDENGAAEHPQEAHVEAPAAPSDEFTRESFEGYKKGFHTKAQELVQLKQQWKPYKELGDLLVQDRAFQDHVSKYFQPRTDQGYEYDETPTAPRQDLPRAVQNLTDPNLQRLNNIEAHLYQLNLEKSIDSIKQQGLPLDTKMETELLEEAYNQGTVEVDKVYWQKFGPKLLDMAKRNAGEKIKGQLQSNRESYAGSIGGSAPTNSIDVQSLEGKDYHNAVLSGIMEEMSRSE